MWLVFVISIITSIFCPHVNTYVHDFLLPFPLCRLLILGISLFPQLLGYLFYEIYRKSYSWGLSPSMYFLSPGQPPQAPLTHLLVINKTGEHGAQIQPFNVLFVQRF